MSKLPYTRSEAKAWGRETVRGFVEVFPTPFTPKGELDEGAHRRNMEKLLEIGADGFLTGGVIAEGWNLTPSEWFRFQEIVAEVMAGKTPHLSSVILDPSPYTAAEKINRLAEMGFNAMEVITPIFQIRSDEQIYEYFSMLSTNTDVALLLYNTPASGRVISHDLIDRLASLETVVGIKNGLASLPNSARLRRRVGDRMVVSEPIPRHWAIDVGQYGGQVLYGGPEYILLGKKKDTLRRIGELAKEGRLTEAFQLEKEIEPAIALYEDYLLWSILERGVYDMSGIKYWYGLVGYETSYMRKPTITLSEADKERIEQVVRSCGII